MEAGAETVLVINSLVPTLLDGAATLRSRGLYTIMQQASRIYSQNLLQLGLATLRFGYASTRAWLETHGRPLLQRFVVAAPQAV